jgi:hypothetical protein
MKGIPIMNTKKIATLLGTVTATVCLISAMGQAANASTFYNDWHYAIDPPSDGADSDAYGGNFYELYGIAIKHDAEADKVYVAINSNFPVTGEYPDEVDYYGYDDYEWGDFFFNFSDLISLDNAQGSLLAVRFGEYNESIDGTGYSGVGVYSGVTATTAYHTIFDSLEDYNEAVDGNGSMADLAINDPYWVDAQGNDPILNVIGSGNYEEDSGFESLNATELTNLGLDFGGVSETTGRETFGFSFNKDLLPGERYIAHVFETCGNDGAAIAVPEPSTMVGLFGLGLTVLGSQISKRRKGNGVSQ